MAPGEHRLQLGTLTSYEASRHAASVSDGGP